MQDFEHNKRLILDRVSLLDVVSEQVTLKRMGRRWVGLCPFHAEKTPSFSVNLEQGFFKCFGCGKGGDLFRYIQFRENVPFVEAMRMLADRAGIELKSPKKGASTEGGEVSRVDLARVNAWAVDYFRSQFNHGIQGRSIREYVSGRGISAESVVRFDLGFAPDSGGSLQHAAAKAGFGAGLLKAADLVRESDDGGRLYDTFRNRLMFPIRDATNRVIGFGGRTLGDDPAKYLNTRQTALFDKGRNLYGVDLARDAIAAGGRAVLVEGYTDCIACHQSGFKDVVATLGTALTEMQVDLLRRYCSRVILLFDSDQAGEAAADRAIHLAIPRCLSVELARVPDGKDPCEFLSRSEGSAFSDVLNRATDALEFKWLQTWRRFQGDASPAGRREAVQDFVRVVAAAADSKAVDAIQRGLLVNQVAHLLGLDAREVDRLMRHTAPGKGAERDVAPTPNRPERRSSVPINAEQRAWVMALETLLNDRTLLDRVGPLPDVSRIVDPCDRRIAEALLAASGASVETRLSDVMANCPDAEDAARIIELAEKGEARGNLEATYRLALERLTEAVSLSTGEPGALALPAPADANLEYDPSRGMSPAGREGKTHKNFVPRRLLREAAVGGQATVVDAAPQSHATRME